jgi:hypothetical protein
VPLLPDEERRVRRLSDQATKPPHGLMHLVQIGPGFSPHLFQKNPCGDDPARVGREVGREAKKELGTGDASAPPEQVVLGQIDDQGTSRYRADLGDAPPAEQDLDPENERLNVQPREWGVQTSGLQCGRAGLRVVGEDENGATLPSELLRKAAPALHSGVEDQ